MRRTVALIVFVATAGLGGAATAADTSDKAALVARGQDIAENVVNCGRCHNPDQRPSGAEDYSGARVEDWYAPAINADPDAPLPWTADELYSFLRTGSSTLHGIAVGSMSDVVHDDLTQLSDDDVRALATYLADKMDAPDEVDTADVAAAMVPATDFVPSVGQVRGQWLYVGYCVSCHNNRADMQSALRPEIALNTAVTAPNPSNLVRVMLRGVTEEEGDPDAYMPGFAMLLSDEDIADVASYLRASFADDAPAWSDVASRAAEIRRIDDAMR